MWTTVQGEATAAEAPQRHLNGVFKGKDKRKKGKSVPLHVPAQAESPRSLL